MTKHWRIVFHDEMIPDHEFVQDPDDIPGGCLVCWNRLETVSYED